MHIENLIDNELLEREIEEKMIRRTTSPKGTHHLYVYTEQAQYKRHWNAATISCRGLVTTADGHIISRPFPKFFNHGEHQEGSLSPGMLVDAWDKLDGSLAVVGTDGTVTSKGSFTSHVAREARRILSEKYPDWSHDEELTFCFEAIFPEGRIVLDYGGTWDLVLLGAVDNATGASLNPRQASEYTGWRGPTAEQLARRERLGDVLAMPPRRNAEGMVLHLCDTGALVKVKQEDYVALHRVVTGTSAITIWEALAVHELHQRGEGVKQVTQLLSLGPDRIESALALGADWEGELASKVPDEFHQWLRDTIDQLEGQYATLHDAVRSAGLDAAAQGFTEKRDLVAYLQRLDLPHGLRWNTVLNALDHDTFDVAHPMPSRVIGDLWKSIRPTGSRWGMKGEL